MQNVRPSSTKTRSPASSKQEISRASWLPTPLLAGELVAWQGCPRPAPAGQSSADPPMPLGHCPALCPQLGSSLPRKVPPPPGGPPCLQQVAALEGGLEELPSATASGLARASGLAPEHAHQVPHVLSTGWFGEEPGPADPVPAAQVCFYTAGLLLAGLRRSQSFRPLTSRLLTCPPSDAS